MNVRTRAAAAVDRVAPPGRLRSGDRVAAAASYAGVRRSDGRLPPVWRDVMKLGRNDPCWCGSGRKYKHCHLGRSREPRPRLEDTRRLVEGLCAVSECLHPEASRDACSGGIVRAHTIQRSGGLSAIARAGHVLEFRRDPMVFFRHDGLVRPELVGISRASTFTGFCARHDSETFRPIETAPFRATQEHAFLLAYRVLCRELYWKRNQVDTFPLLRTMDRGLPHSDQVKMQEWINLAEHGAREGLDVMRRHKDRYDRAVLSGDYSEVRYSVIWLDVIPDVLYAGAWFPAAGFDGQLIHATDSLDKPASVTWGLLATCLMPADPGGVAIIAWLGESEACSRFVRSLAVLDDEEVPDALVRYGFASFENTYFSPAWWDGLSEGDRGALCRRFNAGANIGDAANSLAADGRTYAAWKVKVRENNLGAAHPA